MKTKILNVLYLACIASFFSCNSNNSIQEPMDNNHVVTNSNCDKYIGMWADYVNDFGTRKIRSRVTISKANNGKYEVLVNFPSNSTLNEFECIKDYLQTNNNSGGRIYRYTYDQYNNVLVDEAGFVYYFISK